MNLERIEVEDFVTSSKKLPVNFFSYTLKLKLAHEKYYSTQSNICQQIRQYTLQILSKTNRDAHNLNYNVAFLYCKPQLRVVLTKCSLLDNLSCTL